MADNRPYYESDIGLHAVKLNKHFMQHMAGEVCGFTPEISAELVQKGHATYHPATRGGVVQEPTKPAEVTKFEEKKDEKKFSK